VSDEMVFDLDALPLAVQTSLVALVQAIIATYGPPPAPAMVPVYEAPRHRIRRQILDLLRQHPEGLSPAEVRDRLGMAKDLGSTLKSMYRDGLVQRPVVGLYVSVTPGER
jgi:hypothetical protein